MAIDVFAPNCINGIGRRTPFALKLRTIDRYVSVQRRNTDDVVICLIDSVKKKQRKSVATLFNDVQVSREFLEMKKRLVCVQKNSIAISLRSIQSLLSWIQRNQLVFRSKSKVNTVVLRLSNYLTSKLFVLLVLVEWRIITSPVKINEIFVVFMMMIKRFVGALLIVERIVSHSIIEFNGIVNSSALCTCPECFLGRRCQLSTKGLLIYRWMSSFHQSTSAINTGWIILLIFIFDSISGLLSLLIFRETSLCQIGCVNSLFLPSINCLLVMLMSLLKSVLLIVTQLSIQNNRLCVFSQCWILDFILILKICLQLSG